MSSIKLITPEELRKLRKSIGLTQKALAEKAGVSQSLIARIERKTVDPRLSTLKRILSALTLAKADRTVKDIMHLPVIVIHSADTVRKAIEIMKKNNISQIPVLEKGRIAGSIQESTLMNKIYRSRNPETVLNTHVYNIMDPVDSAFVFANLTTRLDAVLNTLSSGIPAILVLEKGKLLGIVTKIDALSATFKSEE
ncbi:MAG: CBS domain-containing protein [Planctomycetota bacterium]